MEYIAGILTALSLLITSIGYLITVLMKRISEMDKRITKSVNGIVDDRVKSAREQGKAEGVVKGLEKSWREGGMSKRVLIVEDDESILELFRILLDSAGYLVITASDGMQAIQRVQAHRPDLILMDWRIPVVTGEQVYYWIKEVTNAPIVIITGYTSDNFPQGVDVMTKPVRPHELLLKVGSFFKDKK